MNKNEYILKEEAILAINGQPTELHYPDWYASQIKSIKPVDVAPVVHAHWIQHDDADVIEGYYVPEYECSKCRAWKKDDSDFCPDCGAIMDEKKRGIRLCGY